MSELFKAYKDRLRLQFVKIRAGVGREPNYFNGSSLEGVRFLYCLNPTPLDRNLEWDMKTNLCPDPGNLGERRP